MRSLNVATDDTLAARIDQQHGDYVLMDLRDSPEWQLGDCPFVLLHRGEVVGEYPYLDEARRDFARITRGG